MLQTWCTFIAVIISEPQCSLRTDAAKACVEGSSLALKGPMLTSCLLVFTKCLWIVSAHEVHGKVESMLRYFFVSPVDHLSVFFLKFRNSLEPDIVTHTFIFPTYRVKATLSKQTQEQKKVIRTNIGQLGDGRYFCKKRGKGFGKICQEQRHFESC